MSPRLRSTARGAAIIVIAALLVSVVLTTRDVGARVVAVPAKSNRPPSVTTLRTLPVPGGLTDVAYGYGSLWAPGFGVVHRLDPQTGRNRADIPVPGGSDYRYVAIDAGSVWITDTGTQALTRIDPTSNHVVATIALGESPTAITVAGDTIWLTYAGPNTNGLIPVDPRTNRLGSPITVDQGSYVVTTAAHTDDTFWVRNRSQQLARIDALSRRRTSLQALPSSLRDFDIVAATTRSLWFTGPSELVRADPQTLQPLGQPIPIPKAEQVVITPNAVWILTNLNSTQGGYPGQLWELNPRDLTTIGKPHPVGETPVRLLVTHQTVWVANYTDATITAVTLRTN